ncbi:hypothetical protein GUJ93_ZPchr0003g18088 [Zizania palustris]|uniref:Uncharacterized protein n=1 Tax=Zizania palustris TaxID=103762 RepID=A0A8J5SC04_ZIZPA|nr:hypothetical protein GUJ93_ZPchr0003g18088 [Zizania palustris]
MQDSQQQRSHASRSIRERSKKRRFGRMASVKLSVAVAVAVAFLLSGLVAMAAIGSAEAGSLCPVQCIQGGYITCDNYPYQKLDGCDCQCAPKDGENCVLHLEHGPPFNCAPQA